jgi:hypothetical protein
MESWVGKIRMYADGKIYYVSSLVDAVSETIYVGCAQCARMIKEGTTKCPHCGREQEDGGKKGTDCQAA